LPVCFFLRWWLGSYPLCYWCCCYLLYRSEEL